MGDKLDMLKRLDQRVFSCPKCLNLLDFVYRDVEIPYYYCQNCRWQIYLLLLTTGERSRMPTKLTKEEAIKWLNEQG